MLWLGQSRHSQEFCASSRSCDAGGRVCPNWGEHGRNEDAGALFAQLLQMCISGVSLMPFSFEKKKNPLEVHMEKLKLMEGPFFLHGCEGWCLALPCYIR